MMASSTKSPIAIAIPPRLMVFIVRPINLSTTIATSKEIGMAIKEIAVALQFIRKMERIMTTKMEPSISVFSILPIEASIKLA
ncbi:hypothetical protein D3C86_1547840 [compost metagenome]